MNNISFETTTNTTAQTRKFSIAATSAKTNKVIGYYQLTKDFIKATSGTTEFEISYQDVLDLYNNLLTADIGVTRFTDNEAEDTVLDPEDY